MTEGSFKLKKSTLWITGSLFLVIIVAAIILIPGRSGVTGNAVSVVSSDGIVEVSTILQGFQYNPDTITLKEGSTVRLTVYNKDNVGHGFNLKQFGIFGSLQPNSQKTVEFVAVKDSSSGKATYSCSQEHGETLTFNII